MKVFHGWPLDNKSYGAQVYARLQSARLYRAFLTQKSGRSASRDQRPDVSASSGHSPSLQKAVSGCEAAASHFGATGDEDLAKLNELKAQAIGSSDPRRTRAYFKQLDKVRGRNARSASASARSGSNLLSDFANGVLGVGLMIVAMIIMMVVFVVLAQVVPARYVNLGGKLMIVLVLGGAIGAFPLMFPVWLLKQLLKGSGISPQSRGYDRLYGVLFATYLVWLAVRVVSVDRKEQMTMSSSPPAAVAPASVSAKPHPTRRVSAGVPAFKPGYLLFELTPDFLDTLAAKGVSGEAYVRGLELRRNGKTLARNGGGLYHVRADDREYLVLNGLEQGARDSIHYDLVYVPTSGPEMPGGFETQPKDDDVHPGRWTPGDPIASPTVPMTRGH
jgi:hypothetical protein